MPLVPDQAVMATATELQVHLHPMPMICITDYITRFVLNKMPGIIIGAVLGLQLDHVTTFNIAFECQTSRDQDGKLIVEPDLLEERLQQYKETFGAEGYELVGWWSTASKTGPSAAHAYIHQQVLNGFNDAALLFCFHPDMPLTGTDAYPFTVYESLTKTMAAGGKAKFEDEASARSVGMQFREIPYTVVMSEAEAIASGAIAKEGRAATAVDTGLSTTEKAGKTEGKGKGKAVNGAEHAKKKADDSDDGLSIGERESKITNPQSLHCPLLPRPSLPISLPPKSRKLR